MNRTGANPGRRPAEIHYRIPWRTSGVRPGAHLARRQGRGQLFRAHAPLIVHPDPRHLDLRVSSLDPFEGFWVRVYEQRSSIPVVLIADLSASMAFRGRSSKMDALIRFTEHLSFSAHRHGDAFGFIGCDERVRESLLVPASYHPAVAQRLVRKLGAFTPEAASARALEQCTPLLPGPRALVFLVSDFLT